MKGFTIGIRGKIVLTSALIAVLGVASVAALLTWQAANGLTDTAKQGLATAARQEAEHVNGEFARALTAARSLARTTLGFKQPGDPVNLEVDVIAKYVEKMVKS